MRIRMIVVASIGLLLGCKHVMPPKPSDSNWLFLTVSRDGRWHGLKLEGGRFRCVDLNNDVSAYLEIASPEGRQVSKFKCLKNGDLEFETVK